MRPGFSGDPIFIVDTRETADFDAGHIPGAVNIPLQDLPRQLLDGTSGIPMELPMSWWLPTGGATATFACTIINLYRIDRSVAGARELQAGQEPTAA